MQKTARVGVRIATFLIQVVRLRQDGLHGRVGFVSDIDSKVIFVEGTPEYDGPHDPVVGLVGVRWPHSTRGWG